MAHSTTRAASPAEPSTETAPDTAHNGYDPASTDTPDPAIRATAPANEATAKPDTEHTMTRTVAGGAVAGAARAFTEWVIDLVRDHH